MKLRHTIALVGLFAAPPLAAQNAANVAAPAGYAPIQAPCTRQVDGTCVSVSASAPLPVTSQGNAAAGTADSGNPVKMGGVYNSSAPTLTTGQRGDLQLTNAGNLAVQIMRTGSSSVTTVASGADGVSNSIGALNIQSFGMLYDGTSTWNRQRGDTTGAYVVSKGGSSLATGQVSVGTSSTLVAAARAGRGEITVSVGAANVCAFGNTGVTTLTGYPLQPTAGASLTLKTSAAIYAACALTTTISFVEQY